MPSPSKTFLLHIYSQVCVFRVFFTVTVVLFLPVSQEERTVGIAADRDPGQPGVGVVRGPQTRGPEPLPGSPSLTVSRTLREGPTEAEKAGLGLFWRKEAK